MTEKEKPVELNEFKEKNGKKRERNIFVFAKIGVMEAYDEQFDWELYQLAWKRKLQKVLESNPELHVKFVTVST